MLDHILYLNVLTSQSNNKKKSMFSIVACVTLYSVGVCCILWVSHKQQLRWSVSCGQPDTKSK